jgi:hypothetical protein
MRCNRGRGTRVASRCMNSSGLTTRCVTPSAAGPPSAVSHWYDRQLQGDEFEVLDVADGSGVPVRGRREQSLSWDLVPVGACPRERLLSPSMNFSTTSTKVKFKGRPVDR